MFSQQQLSGRVELVSNYSKTLRILSEHVWPTYGTDAGFGSSQSAVGKRALFDTDPERLVRFAQLEQLPGRAR